jgi:hypothetical protein
MKHFLIHKWKFLSPSWKICRWCGLARFDYRMHNWHIPIIEDYFQLVDYDNELRMSYEAVLNHAKEENELIEWGKQNEKNRNLQKLGGK